MKAPTRNNPREVDTTFLVVDREATDWDFLNDYCRIVRYDMPSKQKYDNQYYDHMHNWYKQASDCPCYLHTFGPHLYVKYTRTDVIEDLHYQQRSLSHAAINLQDEAMLPQILKVLMADFFRTESRFVSNAKFFLWANSEQNREFITGLKIEVNCNWRESDDEFVISDQATRLRKLSPLDFDKINDWKRTNQVYYGRFYSSTGMPIFKQLKQSHVTRDQLKEGLYTTFSGGHSNRAKLLFHSVKSLKELRQTRSYLLNQFIDQYVEHLNKIGIAIQRKQKRMWPVHTKSATQMKAWQLPPAQTPIYVVDDRLNAKGASTDFAVHFCKVANALTDGPLELFVVSSKDDLQAGDQVLRLQDYEKEDFDPESGILKEYLDDKGKFYASYPEAVKQTMNVNKNSELKQKKTNKNRIWSPDEYLDYPMPSAVDEKGKVNRALQTQIEVCRSQLSLKSAILSPENVTHQLPQVTLMGSMMFLYRQALIYFDEGSLHFLSLISQFEKASAAVAKQTGWDLMDDVFIPSAEKYYYDYRKRDSAIEDTTKRPFIVSRDFIWEIKAEDGRPIHRDDIIRQRLEILEEKIATKRFYPPQPIIGNDIFTGDQLQAYTLFLDQHVHEASISYLDLKKRYGRHIRSSRGEIVVKDGGFYGLLGINNDSKFRRYLNGYLGFQLKGTQEASLFPTYQGIWYDPDTRHYVAGVKDARPEEQERGAALRQLVIHQGEKDVTKLEKLLRDAFFPLLEVNFIRYRNYTVLPFPFRLIEMWNDIKRYETLLS